MLLISQFFVVFRTILELEDTSLSLATYTLFNLEFRVYVYVYVSMQ